MSLSTGAWIGAGVGLALAIVEYLLVMNLARRNLQTDDPDGVEQRLRVLKRAMMFGFVVLPVLGYLLGSMLVQQGLLPR